MQRAFNVASKEHFCRILSERWHRRLLPSAAAVRQEGRWCSSSAGNNNNNNNNNNTVEYEQGQSPGPKLREYFYYIDHQGMLFLDDARMKNFTSCFKERKFLQFFFHRLRRNGTERYPQFPYVSLCGRERNYVRCDDVPIVYTQMIPPAAPSEPHQVRFNYGDERMVVPFLPEKLIMEPSSGRVYHPSPPQLHSVAPVALVHTKMAIMLAANFTFDQGDDAPPSHISWQGREVPLDYEVLLTLEGMEDLRKHSLGLGKVD